MDGFQIDEEDEPSLASAMEECISHLILGLGHRRPRDIASRRNCRDRAGQKPLSGAANVRENRNNGDGPEYAYRPNTVRVPRAKLL